MNQITKIYKEREGGLRELILTYPSSSQVIDDYNKATILAVLEALEGEVGGKMEDWASVEHIRWAKWQNYLHSYLTWNNDIQAWVLPHEWKDRWQQQINTSYAMLSEKEKESDREQVKPYISDILSLITLTKQEIL